MRCLQASNQLRLASLLLVKNLTVLNCREVQILVEVSGPYGTLFALSQYINEEGDDAEEATLLLKELNVALCQVPPEPLQRVLRGLALLVLGTDDAEVRIVLALRLQVVPHFDLEQAPKRENGAHKEGCLLEHLDLGVEERRVEEDSAQPSCACDFATTVDKFSDGEQVVHFLVGCASPDLIEVIQEEIVDDKVYLLLRHD